MLVYRAMSQQEFEETVKYGKPSFIRKMKWFSDSLDFISSRVRDGRFNHSDQCPDRYVRIVEFDADMNKADWYRGHEIQFNVRRNAKIVLTRVVR